MDSEISKENCKMYGFQLKRRIFKNENYLKLKLLPFPPLHDAGDADEDVGVFGADPDLEAGGENAVLLGSLFPSDNTVNFGDLGDGVLDGFTKVVIFPVNQMCYENPPNFN